MKKQIIFSGIQPSGDLHIGNYIGAIKQWIKLQSDPSNQLNQFNQSESVKSVKTNLTDSDRLRPTPTDSTIKELIFCIVDLHAITVYQDPKILREKNLQTAALYIAAGIDPEKSHIFIQSENPDHPYLAWVFDCVTPIGWMNRMTQFKDKSEKQRESTTVGLFNYPALMAADILLYDTDLVPVGEDQTQHVELTRDIAERFNKLYGETFKLPKLMLDKQAARIMSMQNPRSKMSKSAKDPLGTINLLDTTDEIMNKTKRAVTDSGTEIILREDKPAISNLLVIYSRLTGKSVAEIENQYRGARYSQFKEDLGMAIDSALRPIREKYFQLRNEKDYLNSVLTGGLDYAIGSSSKKVLQVKARLGLGR